MRGVKVTPGLQKQLAGLWVRRFLWRVGAALYALALHALARVWNWLAQKFGHRNHRPFESV